MRITNNMMINKVMRNLNNNMLRLDKLQTQGLTTKRINRPSDDPAAVARSLRVKSDISQLTQYGKNVNDAISWLETTELAAKQTNDALVRVRELMVQAANGPLTVEETTKIQEEIKELKAQIISFGNSSYGNSYIFSGKKIDQPLFDKEGNYLVNLTDYVNPAYVDDKKNIQVANFENIGVNTLGFQLFEAYEKPVVYSEEFPLNSGDTITLQMEDGTPPVTVTLVIGSPEGVTINQDGTEATVTVGPPGNVEEQMEAMINGLKEMAEVYGSPLKGYSFEKYEANEWDGTQVIDGVLRIKATPTDATAVDTRQVAAVWETGDITFTPDTTFTFMGVTLKIEAGASSEITNVTKDGATVVVDGTFDSQMLVDAFEAIAQEKGSKIAGFTFEADGAGLRVIAPENSGVLYNKEIFGGTLGIDNDAVDQLRVAGDAEKKTVVAGQKAGLIQLFDKLEDELLRGNNEEINELLGQIDAFHQKILEVNSEIGAKVNRMDMVSNRVADETINFKKLLSQLEDADMAQVYTDIIREEAIYRSALSIGARIMQPTLLDFLR
ncbi:flagellar hook-associated protein 3 [Anaerovirgula multivorans]|uniref:Flagellar hook-associated protein 3 n=1 Tax=Anaerovirgula multivorans TaxID=312168 RepID=A0A239EWS0_9FIRM|nr:flagellar hook-associated protein FlgL [Anaerovirgula multivorans]SNS49210.1 flagellar hook-associated protein 3 [Anaerovirgula multivorans]